MTVFWTIAGLLLAAALLFLLPPLLAPRAARAGAVSRDASNLGILREQLAEVDAELAAGTIGREQALATRAELQRRLLEEVRDRGAGAEGAVERSRTTAVAVGVAVPVFAVLLYLALGSPKGLLPAEQAPSQGAAHEVSAEQILAMTSRLAERLKANPDDGTGWVMLGRSYGVLGRFADSAAAYAKAEKLFPKDAQLLADYADALAMSRGRELRGEPLALIERALEADPKNLKALALAGTAAFEKRDFALAVDYWQRILQTLPEDSDFTRSVQSSIADAKAQAGGAVPPRAGAGPKPAGREAAPAAAPLARISGTARLSPALAGKASAEDTVFILARAATGPRMPLAVIRARVKDLPLAFSLDDSMAMNPSMKLSNFKEVVVVARVSKSGGAAPQPGDLEGISPAVRLGATGITVDIAAQVK